MTVSYKRGTYGVAVSYKQGHVSPRIWGNETFVHHRVVDNEWLQRPRPRMRSWANVIPKRARPGLDGLGPHIVGTHLGLAYWVHRLLGHLLHQTTLHLFQGLRVLGVLVFQEFSRGFRVEGGG